jgi:hypothetical protein
VFITFRTEGTIKIEMEAAVSQSLTVNAVVHINLFNLLKGNDMNADEGLERIIKHSI